MRYFKYINNGYLIAIGTGKGGTAITEEEYISLRQLFFTKPESESGFDHRLKADLTWEKYELPPVCEEEDLEQ